MAKHELDPFDGARDHASGGEHGADTSAMHGVVFVSRATKTVKDAIDAAQDFLDNDPRGQNIVEHIKKTGRGIRAHPKGTATAIFIGAATIVGAAEVLRRNKKNAQPKKK